MVTFRNNNNRRSRFRSKDRNFKRNGDNSKFKSDFSSTVNFQRNSPGRNNQNAPKLVEKYNDLAREALANEDKILSENYFQHADHFIRVLSEQEKNRTFRTVKDSTNDKPEMDSNKTEESSLESDKESDKESEKQIVSS